MKKVWIITKRELNSFFDSLTAFIMIVLFLGFSGFFTWISGSDVFFVGQASLRSFFGIAYWTLFFFIPALTMRMLAEEKKSGTIEMLLTKPVTDRHVILGKYFATLILIAVALGLTFPYFITVAKIGNIDAGGTICGYLALFLISASYAAIGLFASSITKNQIVAFLTALFIGIFFHILFQFIAGGMKGLAGQIMNYFSMTVHFESLSRGVLDSKDLIYFGSVIFMGLFLTEISMARRNSR
ncbi:MAG TPA: ABC transporter permease subunit [Bacteroidales bacterium]|nr:ABC transporter permease subunit [Bacteroidales bacterium]HPF02753.1 ABC transporter permease subunit [Bacteroidales bacterium]HPJ59023.1 ABC transporter permease subunit [Bacteroidales bacterium]HPR13247.1 ABC transporter permease subunit [Bacteroidales bacterium]HRW84713.1 ABC transporter permease subunit [Bacteroidales bacterium]